jgi:glutamate racemase
VPLAEEGWGETDIARMAAERYLEPLFADDPEIDTLVLGCTHYPLLRKIIEEVASAISGRSIAVVDSASSMAQAASDLLGELTPGRGELSLYVTDSTRLNDLASRFLGHPTPKPELVDL